MIIAFRSSLFFVMPSLDPPASMTFRASTLAPEERARDQTFSKTEKNKSFDVLSIKSQRPKSAALGRISLGNVKGRHTQVLINLCRLLTPAQVIGAAQHDDPVVLGFLAGPPQPPQEVASHLVAREAVHVDLQLLHPARTCGEGFAEHFAQGVAVGEERDPPVRVPRRQRVAEAQYPERGSFF